MPSPSSANDAGKTQTAGESGSTGAKGASADPTQDQTGAAGKKLTQVGKALSSAASDSDAAERSASAGNDSQTGSGAMPEPWDPLLPEPLDTASADGERFDESPAASTAETFDNTDAQSGSTDQSSSDPAKSIDQAAATDGAQTTSSAGRLAGEPSSSNEETGDEDSEIDGPSPATQDSDTDLQALTEALARAGISLTSAGELLSQSATNDAGSDALDAALSDASIAILILEQQLDQMETSGVAGDRVSDAARLVILANEALSDATLATDGRAPLPAISAGTSQTAEDQRIAELDAELERSIVVFEADIQDARNAVAAELAGGPTGAAGGPSMVDLAEGLAQADPVSVADAADNAPSEATVEATAPQGRAPGKTQPQPAGPAPIPDDIPSPQGDDIVAKQLREAAAAEQDPALREKLWDEYKRYKQGL